MNYRNLLIYGALSTACYSHQASGVKISVGQSLSFSKIELSCDAYGKVGMYFIYNPVKIKTDISFFGSVVRIREFKRDSFIYGLEYSSNENKMGKSVCFINNSENLPNAIDYNAEVLNLATRRNARITFLDEPRCKQRHLLDGMTIIEQKFFNNIKSLYSSEIGIGICFAYCRGVYKISRASLEDIGKGVLLSTSSTSIADVINTKYLIDNTTNQEIVVGKAAKVFSPGKYEFFLLKSYNFLQDNDINAKDSLGNRLKERASYVALDKESFVTIESFKFIREDSYQLFMMGLCWDAYIINYRDFRISCEHSLMASVIGYNELVIELANPTLKLENLNTSQPLNATLSEDSSKFKFVFVATGDKRLYKRMDMCVLSKNSMCCEIFTRSGTCFGASAFLDLMLGDEMMHIKNIKYIRFGISVSMSYESE